VNLLPPRLGLFLHGDRATVAVLHRARAEVFVVEAADLAAALRAELDQRQLRARGAAVGLARAATTVKPVELPPVAGELRDMVRFELERHLPTGADDAAFDFLPLPAVGPGDSRRVLLAAVDRRIFERALRLLDEARLRPLSVTVAAHDLLALVSPPGDGRTVWVHRTGSLADLLFLGGRRLLLSRSVPAEESEGLADEIQRSFPVLHWRDCDSVWVSGDDPAVGALARLGAPVTEPPLTPRARAWLERLPEPLRAEGLLALAVAAARRGRPLDLLPPHLRPRRLSRAELVALGLGVIVAGLAVAAVLAPGWRAQRELARINRQIAALEAEVRAVERLIRELDRQRTLLSTVEGIEAGALRPLPVLRDLTELLPADAWLTMLALDPKGVELTGQAQQAAALIPLLENSPRLERVEFASPVTRGRDREQFRIRATWEGLAAPPGPARTPPTSAPPRPAPARPEGPR
jgi:Tfp pilus assembly protein PilN